ncbi:MAG: ferrous iron transport protein B [Clostridiales bacterium]|nr:ferrous iron transport protein B [Clostridiales bacterium]
MGLTKQSTGMDILVNQFEIQRSSNDGKIIALAGNPNVGKSTVFNSLTGLNQHTGNWPGKTVSNAQGKYNYKNTNYILVDIPGTYSLMANSVEEEIARDFICFGNTDSIVIVADATCLERNLNLVLQTLEMTSKVILCVNLLDEAKRKKINIDLNFLTECLNIPVIGTSARSGDGLDSLRNAVCNMTHIQEISAPIKILYEDAIEEAINILEPIIKNQIPDKINSRWITLRLLDGDIKLAESLHKYLHYDISANPAINEKLAEAKAFLANAGIGPDLLRDKLVSRIVLMAEEISNKAVTFEKETYNNMDRKIDGILTSRMFGIPIMIFLLGIILWLTITGANLPSQMLSNLLFWIEDLLTESFRWINAPSWAHGLFVLGMYRTLAWVISVMLPPMAIFFPLFTLLEDLGYLPRVAFNLDNFFKKACTHGKQALTMCMGFGCNAAGIIGCRIIDSPRERLIAIITNNFVPCNGRFPTLIAILTMFFAGTIGTPWQSFLSALLLTGIIVLGIAMTLIVSRLLSMTILKGLPSSFALELPPYRKPQIGRIIVRSVLDRTLFVLGRAICVATPAGLIIWILANIQLENISLLTHCAEFLDPFANLIGLDGYIIMAFILGFPANEIVVPIIIMSYMSSGSMMELDSLNQLRELLISNGWTWLTAVCVMLFSLMHWPCGTTCWTIKKETQSWKWTLASILIPAATGIIICFLVANGAIMLGMV